nr:immunoglobulin light chain junction region [Macaca mulatta]MOX24780.1 immunoglobulin light chain junction region [Macaca mulatta]MOX24934.1 immunoglobulin light chain junction region [Macaca mulatta]
CLQYNSDPWTF